MNEDLLNEQINNIDTVISLEMNVKIRTLDNEFMVNIGSENNVEELKKRIEGISKVPLNRQRLIFRGRLLRDDHSLSSYKISDLDVVHLVAKTGEASENNRDTEENAMNNDSNNSGRGGNGLFSFMNRLFRGDAEGSDAQITDSNNIISGTGRPSTMIPAILGRRTRRSGLLRDEGSLPNTEFNSIECRESIHQNFAALNNLIECSSEIENSNQNLKNIFDVSNENEINQKHSFNVSNQNEINQKNINEAVENDEINVHRMDTISSEETNKSEELSKIELFDLKKKLLIKGQWIDVIDTIDQWLEAQVIDVKENKVYVHYNGWGTRWDEWIEMDSDRIRPFRFHTRQSNYSHFQSPFPITKPDANVSLENNLPHQDSFFDVFDNINKNYAYLNKIMERIKQIKRENSASAQREVLILSKKIAPFLDKLGRTMSDIGGFMNSTMRNNKLEDLDKKLYNSNNLIEELKPYTQTELQQVDTEEAARRSRRETGMNAVTPVSRLDRSITNQVPLIDSSMYIHNLRMLQNQPQLDIYVHTVITPGNSNMRNTTASTNINNNLNNSENLFLNLLNNSRHNTNNLTNNLNIISNSNNSNFRQENQSNVTLNSSSQITNNEINIQTDATEQNNTFLGNKREGDEVETVQLISERGNDNSNSAQNNTSSRNLNNLNIGDSVNADRINSESSYDIIVEEFYENEQDNNSIIESDDE